AKYGLYKGKDYLNYTNEKLLINIQIETLESINNIQEILKVERIDIVFIGLTDLANNLQLSSDDIKFKRKVDNLIEEIKKSGK
ncbi:aldolase/citrate lyase family protein, partial [Staphylococcus equorum]